MATTQQFKEQYFQSYIKNVTNTPSNEVSSVAQIPSDVPLETLVAITTFKPQVIQGTQLQKYGQNAQIIQTAVAARLQQSGIFTTNLRNFTPSISGRAIQVRGGNSPSLGRRINGALLSLNPRDRILRGLDPKTRQQLERIQDLRILNDLQLRLLQQTQRLEQQINKYTAIFNAIVNGPDALVSAGLTIIIDKLNQLEAVYNAAKNLYLVAKRLYENTKRAIIKALFKDIPKFVERVKKGISVLDRILKLPEIPRILRFPKLPKLPKLNWSKADFYSKYKLALKNLKDKNSQFFDKAYDTALQQSGYEIFDPNKDKIQRAFSTARNKLREAKAQFQAKQAIRTAAVETARNQLIDNVRQVNANVERERERILKQYENAKSAGQRLRDQVGSRKMYLTSVEAAQLLNSSRVNVSVKNIYGELPTGQITPDGRTVYKDKENKVYVLQTARERVTELTNKTVTAASSTIREVTSAVDAVRQVTNTATLLSAGLNSDVLKLELQRNAIEEVNNVTQIARQTSSSIAAGSKIPVTSGTLQQETRIDENTKTITTVSRRLRATDALQEAELLNRQKAQQYGYTGILSYDASQPVQKVQNGQTIYEAKFVVTYVSQSLEGRGAQIGLGQGISSTVIGQRPIESVPLSQIRTVPLTGNVVNQIVSTPIPATTTVDIPVKGQIPRNINDTLVNDCEVTAWSLDRSFAVEIASSVARNNGCSLEGRELELIVLTNSTYPNGVYQATVKGSRLTNVVTNTPFIRTSATATLPTASRSPRTTVPPPQIVPGGDIVAIPKLSVFEITALQNRLASPFVSDEEKVRIREILGIKNQITSDLQLPPDAELEFSQEATRPNLSVSVAGNRAKLTYNAGRVANVEYSIDNGRTWTPVNPPARSGDIILDNLENGVYAARVRGIRADGTQTAPSQPKAIVVRASEPRIFRTEAESATGVRILFDDPVSPADISKYQFTTRSDNSLWIDALSATNEKRVVRSPIIAYGLEENKTYTVRIRAVYLDGTFGPPSNTATFTTFKLFTQGGGVIS